MNFGAFLEILPGKEGLLHISKMAKERVEKVESKPSWVLRNKPNKNMLNPKGPAVLSVLSFHGG